MSGANPAVTHVHWTQVTYVVKFTETGLPRGTSWSVTIDGKTDRLPHTSSSITFHVPNGTFSFAVSATGFIETSNPPSPLSVEGADVSVEVTFT